MFRRYVFGKRKFVAGLVAYWKLDGNSNDATGNGHNGTDTAITYIAGKIGSAASFNGSTSVITVPDSNNLSFNGGSPDNPFSISLWDFYSNAGIRGYLSKGPADLVGPTEYELFINNNDIYFRLRDKVNVSNYISVFSNLSMAVPNTWNHIVVTYDGSGLNSGINIYANGVLLTKTNSNSGVYTGMANTTRPVTIGALFNGFFNSKPMDEISIYNREITASDVSFLYNGGAGRTL